MKHAAETAVGFFAGTMLGTIVSAQVLHRQLGILGALVSADDLFSYTWLAAALAGAAIAVMIFLVTLASAMRGASRQPD